MKNARGALVALLLSTSAACGDVPPSTRQPATIAPEPGPSPPALPTAPPPNPSRGDAPSRPALGAASQALSWTEGRDLAVIDGATGAIAQLVSTDHRTGEADVIFNAWTAKAVVFELDEEAQTGEVVSYPVQQGPAGATLGPPAHQAWIDGEARLLPSPLGDLIFEASYGERWKVQFAGDGTTSTTLAPCPASAWITASSGHAFRVESLAYSERGPLVRYGADVDWHAAAPASATALAISPGSDPPTARMIAAPALGDAALFDVSGSDLTARRVEGATAGPVSALPLGQAGLRIEHAIAFDGGRVALLLLSGESRVIAVELSATGAIKSSASLALPGAVRAERRFFSHDLAAVGPAAALAATSAGIFAIQVKRTDAGIVLTLDPDFAGAALRGPIAALAPSSP